MVWANSSNGIYTAKRACHFWYENKFGTNTIPQCMDWKRIWHLNLPHKIKVFVWRFCRNVIPVRKRLSSKWIRIPITCPMCTTDIEHMSYLFNDCSFATGCWNHMGLIYDWSQVEIAQEWLLQQLSSTNTQELVKICVILWGIWHWRKKMWDGKIVTHVFAIDSSFQLHSEWIQARKKQWSVNEGHTNAWSTTQKPNTKWQPLAVGAFKINVDASVFPGAKTFFIWMVLRNHKDNFMAARTHKISGEVAVWEAEVVRLREVLSWYKEMQRQEDEVTVESDSQLTVNAIRRNSMNCLDVGKIIESCK